MDGKQPVSANELERAPEDEPASEPQCEPKDHDGGKESGGDGTDAGDGVFCVKPKAGSITAHASGPVKKNCEKAIVQHNLRRLGSRK